MSRLLVPLLLCLLTVPTSFLAGQKTGPSDLSFVPADAIGFAHVRLGDVWRSSQFKEWRTTVLKAGEKMLSAFDRRFFPTPSSLDRVTIFAVPGQDEKPEGPFVIVATTKVRIIRLERISSDEWRGS
ncbi:MAG: hypothetical protein FJ271_10845 [Planctomycetes bacterium]|nr:hypothetical protein [Planctomycetota bacterium]